MRPLGAFVDEAAARYGARPALVFEDRQWTFAGFREDVDRTARALLALGVASGDRVAVWMPNRPEWLHAFYALATIGGVLVPLNTRFRGAEASYVLRQSGAALLLTVSRFGPHRYADMVRDMAPDLGDLRTVTLGGENVDPLEVEAHLLGHPAVSQVKIVGVPEQRLGEVAAACVILRPGHSATADELVAFCRGRMAGFKVPRHVLFVSGYPMTASGKVQRGALRAQVLTALAWGQALTS